MNTTSELKTLIWDVNVTQTDLIKLGDDALKQTGSFVSWVKCHFFGVRLPFKSLADRAESLSTTFANLKFKLNSFKETHLNQLTNQDKQAFGLLCQFAEQLSLTASVLKTSQTKYLSASQGDSKITFREVCEGSKQYNESMCSYLKVAGQLQPHINRIFDNQPLGEK